jgi:phosphomannomutase
MNRLVVRRTSHALAQSWRGLVVVGYDGRTDSRAFAEDAAGVFAAAGLDVRLIDGPVPTPVVAWLAKSMNAAGAVVVTASHNPPEYNGYKVYGPSGAQIVPPFDETVARALDRLPVETPLACLALGEALAHKRVTLVPVPALDGYFRGVAATVHGLLHAEPRGAEATAKAAFPIAYTALHGVGDPFVRRALGEAGFSHVVSVPEQREPDGRFPTVRFPNPEEPGAMDLVLEVARSMGAKLVLANDPDADRLAVAVPDGAGGFRILTGNEAGLLLGDYLLAQLPDGGAEPSVAKGVPLVISSIVSSPMLARVAKARGARCESTLTGFKWIAHRAIALEAEGARFVFGYEEALGYTVGTLVRDKDGVSAAVVFAELAFALERAGESVVGRLGDLYRKHGLFVSGQRTVARTGADATRELNALVDALRTQAPKRLAGTDVVATLDFSERVKVHADGRREPLALPPQNMLGFDLGDGSRVLVRPSGTEPKLKVYLDVADTLGASEALAVGEARAKARLDALATDVLRLLGASAPSVVP